MKGEKLSIYIGLFNCFCVRSSRWRLKGSETKTPGLHEAGTLKCPYEAVCQSFFKRGMLQIRELTNVDKETRNAKRNDDYLMQRVECNGKSSTV